MKNTDFNIKSKKPAIYKNGTAVMWTDEHISKQLLQVHLNTEVDLASRKYETIKKTCKWILDKAPQRKLKVLDFGCGPGLYTELLCEAGHKVTGVDISKSSISYANKNAIKRGLSIDYINANYLELEMEEGSFDLIILIFTDLGVLNPMQRNKIVKLAHKLLKPEGTFIFDVLNRNNIEDKSIPAKQEIAKSGFWSPNPYTAISESFLYRNENTILHQHTITDEKENTKIYRFWTHYFSHNELEKLMLANGFNIFEFHEKVLPESDLWKSEDVTFCVAHK